MTPQEFTELLKLGHEVRGVEFKGPSVCSDKPFRARVIRSLLAMANHRGGGRTIIGVSEVDSRPCAAGLSPEEVLTWNHDDLTSAVSEYADPYLSLRTEQLVYGIDLRCIESSCVPTVGSLRRITLEPARLVYRGPPPRGGFQPVTHTWPGLVSYSRLDPNDLAARARGVTPFGQNPNRISKQPLPPWRIASDLSPVSYSVRPDRAFWVAIAVAMLLVGAAGLLLRPYLPAPTFLWRRHREPGPLERALAVVESARVSGRQERERRALELLGTELVRSGELQLAESARALAWSQPAPPEPALTTALALDVRKVIEQRSNGQGA